MVALSWTISMARAMPVWRTSATCGWSTRCAVALAMRAARALLASMTLSCSKISRVASAAAQASGLPV
ncbi:hypothetical protein D3C72_2043520 [compost metagenome]